ncbi:hypothetical protein VP1G_09125 [Cytospora mali]|uniref:Myb-like domain-containing protein n=1 Tax=Cytospora mali TaxID=578113 RepID=A0A194VDA6_CYTMA|nr:hypothetical protein VP1G_09125 [Valsa mali var. pyri (nom. inval.)]
MTMTMPTAMYTPTFDVMDRHDYGIKKHRKNPSTGGGRAWSEDEEAYLLQTRLQKMPYKHIAAHLKKTELACRLHYHQLSQGSNRRRRTTSISSSSSFSSNGHSPIMSARIPSPVHEHSSGRSLSPPGSIGSYGHHHHVSPGGVQLPSIMDAGMASNTSPRLPAILPKPANMTLASSPARYAAPQDHTQHSATLLPPVSFSPAAHTQTSTLPKPSHSAAIPSLRIDCSTLPPPSAAGSAQQVDMARLQAVYNSHQGTFWSAVAADYGNGIHPAVLEQAWRTGNYTTTCVSSCGAQKNYAAHTPITPGGSSDEGDVYSTKYQDRTRISAILGIDADPRSPNDRELVRRLEEGRFMVGVGA